MKSRLAIFGAILVSLVIILIQTASVRQAPAEKLSIYGKGPSGLFIFGQFLKNSGLKPKILTDSQLKPLSFKPRSLLIIHSPRRLIRELEAKNYYNFVEEGGVLYLALQDELSSKLAENVFKQFDINGSIERRSQFKNQKTERITASHQLKTEVFGDPRPTMIYSSLQFIDGDSDFNKTTIVKSIGAGQIVLQTGLPFFSNGIIDGDGNKTISTAVANSFDHVFINEYYHHYDKGLWQLIKSPQFFFPMGLLVLALFLSIAYSNFEHRLPKAPKYQKPPVQGDSLILASLGKRLKDPRFAREAISFQSKAFLLDHPSKKAEVDRIISRKTSEKEKFKEILNLKQKWTDL